MEGADMELPTIAASTRAQRVANARAAFKSIVLPYPRQHTLMAELDQLRLTGLATRGEPQDGLRLLAPSGSGKTFGAKRYQAYVEAQPGRKPGSRPVLIVRLKTTCSTKTLASNILDAMGDDYSTVGTEATLMKRVHKAFEIEGTELLIVDEVHHLDKPLFGQDVTDTLKAFLDTGAVPICFLGTHDADNLFKRNKELNGRLTAPCSLPPLEWEDEADRKLFVEFAKRLDAAIVKKRILPVAAGLGEEWLAKRLHNASNGIIGQFCRIVRTAMEEVIKREGDCVGYEDLRHAVNAWSIPNGFRDTNPLDGDRP